jgi:two-component system phosphate regulon sensor histidine kinase PhoR
MKKRSIALIIGLMSFALLGVMGMQLYFLRQSYQVQSDLFDRSVNDALTNVASKLSKQDAINFLNKRVQDTGRVAPHNPVKNIIYASKAVYNETYIGHLHKPQKKLTIRERRLARLRDSLKKIVARNKLDDELFDVAQQGALNVRIPVEGYTDDSGNIHYRITSPEIIRAPNTQPMARKPVKLHKYDTLRYEYPDPQFGLQVISVTQINPFWQREQDRKRFIAERRKQQRQFLAVKKMLEDDSLKSVHMVSQSTVIENVIEEYQKSGESLRQRLNAFWIDTILRAELHNKGIFLPITYEVTTANNDSLIFSSANDTKGIKPTFVNGSTYQTPIFTKDIINDPGRIRISFPQKSSWILNGMTATMATSGGLLFILVFCFSYTIFSILKQKKISEMKTDFINNMTHEFKTPVSTIMIASEALKDKEIADDKARVARLANIIYEENERLGSHIERVLNSARIEKNDFKLDIKVLDVNEMISTVLDSMALKLQKYDVLVTLHLDAAYADIKADELHFSNVLYNLIDNAIKYSNGQPDITLTTQNKSGQIVIRVADKGIGMSRDQQARIFEQFYRIPTGNLHDVKGFGLGLSYVNTIVKRLDGSISVKSEKDKGSEFELKFPLS